MKGKASGNTEMSARRRLSACSSDEVRVPDSRANTISSATRNSSRPPKMRNESMLMPMAPRKPAPLKAKPMMMPVATSTDLTAMRLR